VKKIIAAITIAALALLVLGWASASTVQSEIRDYQKRGTCARADLNFDRKVNEIDTKLVQDWFGRGDAPVWFDQDRDGRITIFDIASVAGQNGKTC